MDRKHPINSVGGLLDAMLKGINPIYVTPQWYMKKYKHPEKKQYGMIIGETIQIAYAYGCEFIEVKEK